MTNVKTIIKKIGGWDMKMNGISPHLASRFQPAWNVLPVSVIESQLYYMPIWVQAVLAAGVATVSTNFAQL